LAYLEAAAVGVECVGGRHVNGDLEASRVSRTWGRYSKARLLAPAIATEGGDWVVRQRYGGSNRRHKRPVLGDGGNGEREETEEGER
jgi:hypothetical protein